MKYLKLMRVKHYVKNIFIFVPLFFSYSFMNFNLVKYSILAFISFSLISSCVYIINDIMDVEKDRLHPKKCKRPIASNEITINQARILLVICFSVSLFISGFYLNLNSLLFALIYFFMNLAYSIKLKHVVLIDVFIIAFGFILRVFVGAASISVPVSEWLLLTTFALSLFLGFGKRLGEKVKISDSETRKVLNDYSEDILKKFLLISLTLTIVFYSLYTILGNTVVKNAVYTVPIVVIGLLRYYMLLENNIVDGDPTEVIFGDAIIRFIGVLYVIMLFVLVFI